MTSSAPFIAVLPDTHPILGLFAPEGHRRIHGGRPPRWDVRGDDNSRHEEDDGRH